MTRMGARKLAPWLIACALCAPSALADPSPAYLVKDIHTGPGESFALVSELADVGGTAYFGAHTDAAGDELWKTDGTPAGTALVRDLLPVALADGFGFALGPAGDTYLFAGRESQSVSHTQWKSDGTAGGTRRLAAVRSRSASRCRTSMGVLFFAADDGVHGEEPHTGGRLESRAHGAGNLT